MGNEKFRVQRALHQQVWILEALKRPSPAPSMLSIFDTLRLK
jgi:hypothetical protein